ncbi:IS110 family transposase [Ancylomarina salipaludis]|uniref:IS110 family transposase n=1 Tax=Ancylomarina salipaludis TaxID=2501299 RepID=A0A4Q1JHI2_9BACT|nr:IS110 family transposase [Ancylomarina salipaludis]RXQ87057.1 IS110 family transposase [Ancylomarina salipaludis]
MRTQVIKKIDFSEQNLYIGLDVHKKSWQVTVLSEAICLKTFTSPPEPNSLFHFMECNFPGASYYSAYEAGFSGYATHRQLNALGIENIVVNPADIPRRDKDSHYKTDKSDSRMIAEALRAGLLKGIYVFDPESEGFRGLFRSRLALAKDIRRTKGRIKGFLAFKSISIPGEFIRNPKSSKYLNWLKGLDFQFPTARIQLDQLINNLLFLMEQRRMLEQKLRDTARKRDRHLFKILQTVPGIGPITAIGIMAEIGEIGRFKHFKQFASYVGLVPRLHQSGEKDQTGSITYRSNNYLRPLLIESAWQAVRADPAMLKYYQENCLKGNAKKAIVKVARKLLSKIMHVMRNRVKYERGIA